jgi:hypothetical protein
VTAGNRDWMDDAACRHRPDLDWFDLDCYLEACLTVCVTCKVADRCLDYAVSIGAIDGLWGGEWGYRLQAYTRPGRLARGGE